MGLSYKSLHSVVGVCVCVHALVCAHANLLTCARAGGGQGSLLDVVFDCSPPYETEPFQTDWLANQLLVSPCHHRTQFQACTCVPPQGALCVDAEGLNAVAHACSAALYPGSHPLRPSFIFLRRSPLPGGDVCK